MFSGQLGMHHKHTASDSAAAPARKCQAYSVKNLHQTPPVENLHHIQLPSVVAMNHHKAESQFSDPFWLLQDPFGDQSGNALVPNNNSSAASGGLWRDVGCDQQPAASPPGGGGESAMNLPELSSDSKPDSGEIAGGKRSHSRCVASKNLVSERKRRKKLNEGLFQLRAQVPKISKMDKASIIGDAIDYVRELQKELEDIELEIDDLEQKCSGSNGDEAGSVEAATGENFSGPTISNPELVQGAAGVNGVDVTTGAIESSLDKASGDSAQAQLNDRLAKKILEVDVVRLEEQTYHLRIFCQKGPGVLVQLVQAVESLGVQVLNAHHIAFQENILNSFIAEMKDPEMETEDVRRSIFSVAAQHGLVQG